MNLPDFPALKPADVAGAVLYADRDHLIDSLQLPAASRIGDTGIGSGDFSWRLMRAFRPAEFHAFDAFDEAREAHFRQRMAGLCDQIQVHPGPVDESLQCMPSDFFDFFHLNSTQDYEALTRHARQAGRLLREGGLLLFKNYTLQDPFQGTDYGIVPVVNTMVVQEGWRVAGFVLQQHLFCDILLTR